MAAALLTATPAFAHPGHDHATFLAGALHPLSGWDHLLAMLMTGLWSGLAYARRGWVAPVTFLAAMLLGFGWGMAAASLGLAELLILASLAMLGLMLWRQVRVPLAVALPVIALFAIGHGAAHGIEMPAGGASGFAAGMALSAAALLGLGYGAARALRRRPAFARGWTR